MHYLVAVMYFLVVSLVTNKNDFFQEKHSHLGKANAFKSLKIGPKTT